MKTYKIRSLIYLGCFVASAVVYYNFEQQKTFTPNGMQANMVDNQFEDAPSQEKEKLISEKTQDLP